MLCKKCGKRIETDSRQCGKCGERVVLSGVSVLEISAELAEGSMMKTVMPAIPVAPEPVETKPRIRRGRLFFVLGILAAVVAGGVILLSNAGNGKEAVPAPQETAVPVQEEPSAGKQDSTLQKTVDAWKKNNAFSSHQTVVASYTIESIDFMQKTMAVTSAKEQLVRSDVTKTEKNAETKVQYYTDSTSGFHNLYMLKDDAWSTQAVEGELPLHVIGIGEKEVILQYLSGMEKNGYTETATYISGTLDAESAAVVLSRLCPKLIEEYKKTDPQEDAIVRLMQELPGIKIKVEPAKDTYLPNSLILDAEETVAALEDKLNGTNGQKEKKKKENTITIELTYQDGTSVELPVEADRAQSAEIVRKDGMQ